ncbi:hypothetical protein PI124_g20239 [Phytophthora idaei]|nr:hypothetical protein PI124_g20239 [Phytophthora idaei]
MSSDVSGLVSVESGAASASGDVSIVSGDAVNGDSGAVRVSSGSSSTGSGGLVIVVGGSSSAAASVGNVLVARFRVCGRERRFFVDRMRLVELFVCLVVRHRVALAVK